MASDMAVIALGSNLGDKARTLWWAIQQLNKLGAQVQRCSSLYETAPAYVTDQPSFLNAAVMARMQGSPRDLLQRLKAIEAAAGRDLKGQRWGPRPLDLDIIFTAQGEFKDETLQVPHPRWRERPFVLQPVSDLWHEAPDSAALQHGSPPHGPSPRLLQQVLESRQLAEAHHNQGTQQQSTSSMVQDSHRSRDVGPQQGQQQGSSPSAGGGKGQGAGGVGGSGAGDVLQRVTPLGPAGKLVAWGQRTLVMGILNITPDSFSDGGTFTNSGPGAASDSLQIGQEQRQGQADIGAVVAAAVQMMADGADILDVGGQSTRPGATHLDAQQELARVMPVIRALRTCPQLQNVLLSIDTFHAKVAQQAVEAGVQLINDVSGGILDPLMHSTVAALGVPYVLMHMRGTPQTMQEGQHTDYQRGDAWRAVSAELQQQADKAVAAGIPAWHIILDPGLGFAKSSSTSIELLSNLQQLRQTVLQGAMCHAPMLVGPSRKGFLGMLTGRKVPAERDAATVAAAALAVAQGADIVRVHNVRDVCDGVRVADALRQGFPAASRRS